VAVKRMGNLDALSREFAREHSDRLWKQLVLVPSDSGELRSSGRTDATSPFFAVAAAVSSSRRRSSVFSWTRTAASMRATSPFSSCPC
jgi:hypothetical protein